MPRDDNGLTPKQAAFVQEYLIDLNGTRAAIQAGYSKATAQEQSSRLLSKVIIQAAIKERMAERAKRTEIDQDWVIVRLAAIAGTSMTDLVSWGPEGVRVKQSSSLDYNQAYSVKKVKDKRLIKISSEDAADEVLDIQFEFEQHDKLKALELLGKHVGLFSDKLQVSGDPANPLQVAQIVIQPVKPVNETH